MAVKVRTIAFYLPQFFPTPENDAWWEPGFTEWTNTVRAKPLFEGHYQPRLPRDLGFYDLRVAETRERQAQLAREAGIEGFCYWHYWFGGGKRLLDWVFREVVECGKPDYPFCLCWANHSWFQKTWDPNKPDKLLMEQTYPGVDDYTAHFMTMLPAFKDKRYMRMDDGRLIFGVFDAFNFPGVREFFDTWNKLARENGLPGFYFFGMAQGTKRYALTKDLGYDTVVYDCLKDHANIAPRSFIRRIAYKLHKRLELRVTPYSDYADNAVHTYADHPEYTPCLYPDFDHSPRSGFAGVILHESTPEKWGGLLRGVTKTVAEKPDSNRLLFIKAWNEWGEGNYLEPDARWGRRYLDETAKVLGVRF